MPGRESAAELEHAASSSQADTEPLPFDDDAEPVVRQVPDATMASFDDNAAAGQGGSVQGTSPADTSMDDVDAAAALTSVGQQFTTDNNAESGQNAPFSDALTGLEDDEDAPGEDDEDAMGSDDEGTAAGDGSGTVQGGEDTGVANSSAAGAGFSDGSELTDESDEEEAEEEEDDNDEMGGGTDDEEEDDEEDDEEDADAEGEDEDEAAKGLAALTGAHVNADESGLDGLAVLAAAGVGDVDDRLNEDSDSESVKSALPVTRTRAGKGRYNAKPRLGSRLNEVMVASEQTSGAEDDEDALNDDEDIADGSVAEEEESTLASKARSREMSSLGQFASAAKRTAARSGPAAGLLAGAPSITIEDAASGAASLATTPAGSPKAEDDDGLEGDAEKVEGADGKDGEEEDKEIGLETPVQELEEAVADEDPSTDEAALKRQEAIDALTKIEIGFAVLRDKLYVERMEEISKEGEMILDGSHPDLIYLTNFIEARRERRLKLVDLWFAQQQKQYERVAHVEEAAAWNNWRNEVVQLRQQQLDEASRKRRKLDREKRSLDGPRPARRHQIFETELVRNPDFDNARLTNGDGNAQSKKDIDPRQQELEDLDEMGAYVAYPDLRAADEQEAWMDMERIGIQPDVRIMQGAGFYRMDEMPMDGYSAAGMYNDGQVLGRDMPGAFGGSSVGGASQSHIGNGGMDERFVEPNIEIRDHHGHPHGYVDAYGNSSTGPPSQRFGGPGHVEQAGRHMVEIAGHSRNGEPIYADEGHMHDMHSRKRAFSPGPDPRHHMDDRMYGAARPVETHPRKNRVAPMPGHRSPPPPMPKAGSARKSGPGIGGGGGGGGGGGNGQRPMYGIDGRGHPDEAGGFYDGPAPPPPSHMHGPGYGPPPPSSSSKMAGGKAGYAPPGHVHGHMHDSPQQHHRQQHHMHPNGPPPPRMPHPMHNGPMPPAGVDYPGGARRAEQVYPH